MCLRNVCDDGWRRLRSSSRMSGSGSDDAVVVGVASAAEAVPGRSARTASGTCDGLGDVGSAMF